ncbi:hypothetical protein FQN54_000241 [Arachnomyces sp. PD_36]|nr:hypothetical protein FQN54_000241 [Arachnomyces sp. PD_36]
MKLITAAFSLAGLISSAAAVCDDNASGSFTNWNGETTGGAGANNSVIVTTQKELEEYAVAEEPYIIKIPGRIDIEPVGTAIKVGDNKTIVGSGEEGEIYGGGFLLDGSYNVIFRSLTIGKIDSDEEEGKLNAFQLNGASRVWIDHCLLTRTKDALIESTDSSYFTVSYSHFLDNKKGFEIGASEGVESYISAHHNYFQNLDESGPDAENVKYIHSYDNYLSNVTSYGHYSRGSTAMHLSNVVFEEVDNPILRDEDALLYSTFSIFENCTGETAEESEKFPEWRYYEYYLHAPDEVIEVVTREAGPKAWVCPLD